MRFMVQIAVAAAAALFGSTVAFPVVVSPGGPDDVVLTVNNTINATIAAAAIVPQITGQLNVALVNNLGTSVNAYVTGLDSNNKLALLQPNGQWYYPAANGATAPVAITTDCGISVAPGTTQITLPSYLSAGRIWFAEGELQFFVIQGNGGPSLVEPSAVNPSDPSANVNWGFVELTNTDEGGLFANISYVDFVGLVLGMTLKNVYGALQTAFGLQRTAVTSICNDLKAQSAIDGQAWADLCVYGTNGQPLRVLNPTDYLSINPSAFSDYWTSYIDAVWGHYSTSPLTIDTQVSAGQVSCTVYSNMLNCAGDNRGYAKPTAGDIFGCNSGPFAIESSDNAVHRAVVPRLCAAFDRSTLLLGDGNTQPGPLASEYYTTSPTNWYSAIVHKYEVDGKGYAFSYDDVAPDGDVNQSGVVADPQPELLTITIGGPN